MGVLLTGVFASDALGGSMENLDIGNQLRLQAVGIAVTVVYSGVLTFILVKVIDGMIGIRVTAEEEGTGLDLALHDERGFNLYNTETGHSFPACSQESGRDGGLPSRGHRLRTPGTQ